jgi:thymidylate kinase
MIIEFVGPPGTGKSFAARFTRDLLAQQGQQAIFASEYMAAKRKENKFVYGLALVKYSILFFIRNPMLVGQVLLQQSIPLARAGDLSLLRSFLSSGSFFYYFQRARFLPDPVIFDGSLQHFSVSLFASEKRRAGLRQIAAYCARVPKPDVSVFVRSSIAACMERLRTRELPRRIQGQGPNEIKTFLQNQLDVLEVWFSANSKTAYEIENSSTKEKFQQGLEDLVDRILETAMVIKKPPH